MTWKAILFSTVTLAATIGGAEAQNQTYWGTSGNWTIYINHDRSNGCYATVSWVGGTELRIGLNPQYDNFYIQLSNPNWTSLAANNDYDMQIRFDSRPIWDVSASTVVPGNDGRVFLQATSSKEKFLNEFMAANAMKLSYQGQQIESLKLNGSRRAFGEVRNCQRAQGGSSSDPFSGSSGNKRKSSDPFAN